jgi:ribosomal protein L13E
VSTKQLLAEIDRGIKALQKARALCLKGEAVAPKVKAIVAKTVKVTRVPAKKVRQGRHER